MARELRIAYPGAFYHIMARGNEKKIIFKDRRDYRQFIKDLEIQHIRHKIRVHAYCLMNNHYHLLMETPQANVSKVMQELQTSYAVYYNWRHERVGHLFQGRFKAKLVQTDVYLRQVNRYIHRNPVKARIVKKAANYPWTSYCYFIGRKSPPRWLVVDDTLQQFGDISKRSKVIGLYKEYVGDGREDEQFTAMVQKGVMIATEEFKAWIKKKFLEGQVDPEVPDLKRIDRPEICRSKIMECVEQMVQNEKLARKCKIFMLRKYTSATWEELAEDFGGVHYKTISKIFSRFEKELNWNAQLLNVVRRIEKNVDVEI